MSHQTGIKANDELRSFLAKYREEGIRAVKITIENEEMVLSKHMEVKNNNWEKDFDKVISGLVDEDTPCYIFYRFDTKNTTGYEWLLLSWMPEQTTVRQRMLYASTKATLKQEFGTSQIKEELLGAVSSEISLRAYQKFKKDKVSPAPLTAREEELQEIKKTEVHTDYGVNSRQQHATGVRLPITDKAKQAILDMINGVYNYVQFEINLKEELINLVTGENIRIEKLPSNIPDTGARYHLFRFKHTHEGDYMESILFIYSMPYNSCTVKERMMYSSCKNPLIDTITDLGLLISKSLEIQEGLELTEVFIYDELHPTNNLPRPQFAKPKGPPNRGPKRMTKSQNAE